MLPVAAAAGLAVWSLGFGLPYLLRSDEDVMVGRSVRMVVEHSLDPLFYNYPPLGFYVFAAAEAALRLLPGQHLGPATRIDPSAEYLAARAVSALALVAATALVYRAGRSAYGTTGGVLAATCLALAPLAVRQAHFATTDSLAMALVALTFWAGQRAGGRGGFLLAGVVCGLAAATKYTSAAAAVYLVVLVLAGPDRWGRLVAAAGGAAIAFAAVFVPATHPLDYLRGLAFLGGRAGQEYAGLPLGLVYHPTVSLPFGLGFGGYAMALAGMVVAVVRRARTDLALLAFVGGYFLASGLTHEVFFRYALPMLPALCLLAGGVVRAVPGQAGMQAAAGALALLLLAPAAYASVTSDRLLGAEDTRQQAAGWLQANAPPGSQIRIGSYWWQPFYDASELGDGGLHAIYATGNPIVDSFQMGRYTDRFSVARVGSPCYALAASGPPWQSPPPGTASPPVATFKPYTGAAPAGAVYDPIDSFYLPIWGFASLDRPGPALVIEACG